MKSVFTLHPYIARAVEVEGLNPEQLVNAIQSDLNDRETINQTGSKAKAGNGSLREKGTRFLVTETVTDTYEGDANSPRKFFVQHNAFRAVWVKYGEPAGEVTLNMFPADTRLWLEKFRPGAKKTVKVKLNGRGRNGRNMVPAEKESKADKPVKPESNPVPA